MKKALTLFAAVMLLASASFAQTARRESPIKSEYNKHVTLIAKPQTLVSPKTAGDTVSTFPWTEGFESTTLTGFTFVDADGDGYGWDVHINDGQSSSLNCNSGDGCIYSASWLGGTVLTPDNWMILPAFTLPSDASEFNLSWFARGQDPDYANEHYCVYISTAGNTPANFTATTAVYDGTSTDTYVKHTISLANYAGQTIFIAFRHHNSTDVFYLNIDDIRVGGAEAPTVAITGPTAVEVNSAATFTASGATTFEWTVDGATQTETGATLAYTFTTTGSHTVTASATNSAGTGTATLNVNVFDCNAPITEMPWNEGFEGSTDCWRFITVDTTSDGFTLNANGYGHDESNTCLLGGWSDDSDVDQWAISPMITLPTNATNYILKFYAYTREYAGVSSHYEVRLTTVSDPLTSDFNVLLHNETSATNEYAPHTVSLGDYAGQTIRIAFHNITGQEGDAMQIDDIYIGAPLVPDLALEGPEDVIVGEQYEWTAISDATTFEWEVDGVFQSEASATLTYTFSTAGSHTISVSAINAAGTSTENITVNAIECNPVAIPHNFDLATEFNLCWDNPEGGWDTLADDSGNTYLYSMSNLYGFIDLDPDNWIYTPTLTMPAEGSFDIAWQVAPYTTQLPSDHYGVYVVQGDNATLLREETLNASMNGFQQRVVSIPASITGDFKIAFRHYETSGGYVILLGDIKVVTAGSVVSIDDVNSTNVAVYPNPANNVLNVEGEGISQVQLMDINGRTVMTANNGGMLNIGSLANGVYVIRVVNADGVHTQKIVKQ